MDGYSGAREIRARLGRSLTLVALTGYGSQTDVASALDAGFDLHITKPVDFDALTAILARLSNSEVPINVSASV